MMMSQIAETLDASLYGRDVMMTGVSKDSRHIRHGDLYVALVGERFNGHKFVEDAGSAGAAGALVSEMQPLDLPQVKVNDTRLALGQLAAHWRNLWRNQNAAGKLIGITGSNGKTSVKEMCRKILVDYAGADTVLSTKGNLNNDIGLPMMLLELRQQHQYAVIEMGANHMGEIDYLTAIAKPDVAVVTNVGPAHLEGFGSLQNIAKAKAEIYNGLSENGVAVINLDDAFNSYWMDYCENHCAAAKIVSFSMLDETADVYAMTVSENRYQMVTLNEQAELSLKVPGKHNVMNALAAIAATRSVGIPLQSIVSSLAEFENIQGRLTLLASPAGYQVIDDSYNANPLSVSAAIDVLAAVPGDTVLVLGDMAELGEDAQQLHAEIGRKAKSAGIKALYATGKYSATTVAAFGDNGDWFEHKNELVKALKENLKAGDTVLIKGSRSAAMEKVVEQILTPKNNNKRVD
ncbi:MAG: UDP-N-acetylmuramoyl-tripeptide--D-alanyl-D-alanine ligase [Gammaproteobacteria bacterium]|jgi:UDP-N-acetylmuramoyl-tripeptide--D-alanyl-D-alanine ligase|nr:UDP-N-acetylmuramoyl-tripeptide--D-alanyl-D-alanine ligase [Gammaproteobacteria bacterium]